MELMNLNKNNKSWRSLDELAQTEEFQRRVENEFAVSPLDWQDGFSRRRFLQLMGASMALAGLNACTRQPEEKIFPYVQQPEQIVPGKPLFYATAMIRGGYAYGVLAESHTGRPTKIEGNPEHPASFGATDVFAQASVLELYDPDRSQVVTHLGRISTWEIFLTALQIELESQKPTDGAGLRILTETITSPTLAHQLQNLLSQFPLAKWHQYEPVNRDNARLGSRMTFGEFLDCRYDFSKADYILSLDSDFLTDNPGSLKYTRDFTMRRKVEDGRENKMNRLYVVESTPTLTGAMADHRLPLAASEIAAFAAALAQELEVTTDLGITIENTPTLANVNWGNWMKVVAKDLRRHRGAGLVIAGESQPPVVHALAHAINSTLGNAGQTAVYSQPVEARPVVQVDSLKELVDDMNSGAVNVLVILSGNPVFNAPADLDFLDAMKRVPFRVHLGLHPDETAEWCHWHIPQTHYLEHWSDARAFDGTASILQPLIAPLYGGKSAHEFLATFTGQAGKPGHDIVREYWQTQYPGGDFEKWWRTAVHDGVVPGTALAATSAALKMEDRRWRLESPATPTSENLEITFRPDPTIWDGRYVNNGWLQELPKPITKLTWDNAALISPRAAENLNLKNGEVVELKLSDHSVEAPVWILPGQPENSVTVHFGYGRTRTGKVGASTGFNAYALRTSQSAWFGDGLQISKTGKTYALATTQMHHTMENRHLARTGTLAEFIEHPEFVHELGHDPDPALTLYPDHEYNGYAWGMAVDLNSCTGCNACTVACQSENNIPVVGKEQVLVGREMHWIRIDHYFEGEADNPESVHQPVMCQHCENAPCEVVCPVAATTHSAEGLNEMVYNRCVGTRYCANNCPYKVRRFNFFLYSDFETPSLKMMRNPDVTVRSRGIMEKCTYCVQRINTARIDAKNEDRQIRDGEILTACQQVCPADAIVFGDINDPNSRVSKLRAQQRNYGILTDLNTRPRTTYLAKLRNPNPELLEA
jgi:molybdopterin-containing oxidoreductase family iron-sulfur binding subunit